MAKSKPLTIDVQKVYPYCDEVPIYFVATVREAGDKVASVEGRFLWLTTLRAKRAVKLYRSHGISVFA